MVKRSLEFETDLDLPLAGMPAPDTDGWWAFEGRWNDNMGGDEFRCIYWVFDGIYINVIGNSDITLGTVNDLTGVWWKVETPWWEG